MIAHTVAAVMVGALAIYALSGGADFGGGVWDLFASGPRRDAQRATIARALAPIWEANHVWLIVVLVLLFIAFPSAFARIGIALHPPLAIMLVGIVLRGSAFVFRAYGPHGGTGERVWGRVFAIASLVTPFMLGVSLGAAASGRIDDWLAPFPFLVGALCTILFAFLAAVYLIHETDDGALREDFRLRALLASGALIPIAWAALLVSDGEIRAGLLESGWALPFHAVTAIAGAASAILLWRRRWQAARIAAIVLVVLIVGGWAAAQYPWVLPPHVAVGDAAPDVVLLPALVVLGVGAVLVLPAFVYLYRVFKKS